jgi:hypothetical protein
MYERISKGSKAAAATVGAPLTVRATSAAASAMALALLASAASRAEEAAAAAAPRGHAPPPPLPAATEQGSWEHLKLKTMPHDQTAQDLQRSMNLDYYCFRLDMPISQALLRALAIDAVLLKLGFIPYASTFIGGGSCL